MTTHPRFYNPACDVDAAADAAALAQGLAVSGVDNRDGVRRRLAWLAACLRQLGEQPTTVEGAFFSAKGTSAWGEQALITGGWAHGQHGQFSWCRVGLGHP
jgi:hypothetical protein